MRYSIPLVLGLFLYSHMSYAGSIMLNKSTTGSCRVEIKFRTASDEPTGMLDIRNYKTGAEVLTPCSPSAVVLTTTLISALSTHEQQGLKPIGSIFLGRVFRYDWIKSYLADQKPLPAKPWRKRHDKLFNSPAFLKETLKPLQDAMAAYNMTIPSARCEKLLTDQTGKVTDAMCWLRVESK